MRARHKARECALQVLFEIDASKAGVEESIESFFERFSHREDIRQYAEKLTGGASKAHRNIDAIIRKHAKNWRLGRMARVDRCILRLSVYELLCEPQVPKSVAINEAVELAKKYGGEESGAFVNGILDAAARELRPDEPAGGRKKVESG